MSPREQRVVSYSEAAALLAAGDVVALPTDTVYGLCASVRSAESITRLFRLKERPETIALPILIAGVDELASIGVEPGEREAALARAFWPGPLTIVLEGDPLVARLVGSIDTRVGVRVPDDDELRDLLRESGPLAVTSANRHGHEPCHTVSDVRMTFRDDDELVAMVDGGRRNGAVSTVVAMTTVTWSIERDGPVGVHDIEAVLERLPLEGPDIDR